MTSIIRKLADKATTILWSGTAMGYSRQAEVIEAIILEAVRSALDQPSKDMLHVGYDEPYTPSKWNAMATIRLLEMERDSDRS